MSAKPSPPKNSAKLVAADDFRLIGGITRMIENRLHAAGILTFDQLAESKPEQLAEILRSAVGVTMRRAAHELWIAEARKRAARYDLATPGAPRPELINEGFVLDLFLDAGREVQLTQVLHVKSDVGESWYGWDADRLLGFFTRNSQVAGLKPPANSLPEAPSPIEIRAIQILSAQGQPGSARGEEALRAQLSFHLHKPFRASSRTLSYCAEVRARSPQGDPIILATAEGALGPSADSIQLAVPAGLLATGLYRIRGTLTVTRAGAGKEKPFSSTASMPGGMLRIM